MKARHPGRCPGCGQAFPKGTQIAWARGEGAWHVACAPEYVKEARSTLAPSPASSLPQVERPSAYEAASPTTPDGGFITCSKA